MVLIAETYSQEACGIICCLLFAREAAEGGFRMNKVIFLLVPPCTLHAPKAQHHCWHHRRCHLCGCCHRRRQRRLCHHHHCPHPHWHCHRPVNCYVCWGWGRYQRYCCVAVTAITTDASPIVVVGGGATSSTFVGSSYVRSLWNWYSTTS